MRIPFSKHYRAFPEFDNLPDEECRRHMRAVVANFSELMRLLPLGVGITVAAGWALGVLAGDQFLGIGRYLPLFEPVKFSTAPGTVGITLHAMIWLVVTSVGLGGMTGLLLRDWLLWRALGREVHRTRCRRCGYSLLGVPLMDRGQGHREPGDFHVRCPECGKRWVLLEVGLTPRDLIPYEERLVREDVGEFKNPALRAVKREWKPAAWEEIS